jgi:hypothetical protein
MTDDLLPGVAGARQPVPDQYEALGITSTTWACVAVLPEPEAARFCLYLAASGVPVRASRDGKPNASKARGRQLWHVAVQGGLKASPMAWLVSIRGEAQDPATCPGPMTGQHPQASREPDTAPGIDDMAGYTR